MAVPRLVLALAAALLLAPLAAAASAHGALDVTGAAETIGTGTLDATHGDLLWNATGVPDVRLHGTSFTVVTWGQDTTVVTTPLGPGIGQPNTPAKATTNYGSGDLRLDAGKDLNYVVLTSRTPLHATVTDAALRPVTSIMLANGPDDGERSGCLSPQCADERGVYEIASTLTTLDLTGSDLLVFAHGPAVVLTTNGQPTTIATGEARQDTATVSQYHDAWALVMIKTAKGTVTAKGPTSLYADAPALQVHEAEAKLTQGDFRVGLQEYRAVSEALHVTGDLRLVPGSVDKDQPSFRPHYAPGFSMEIQGDVQTINLHAIPVYASAPAATGGLLGLAAIVAAIAYFWPQVSWHATTLALPLYTRLKQPEILANEVRNTIYEIIRAHPGISAREVHRQSDQSWGTVVYHLRQLERHHLVVSRSVGRTRNYYENHGKYRGMEVQLACLQSSRARALAHLVNTEAGITQEDLVTKSGFPQPTTSYYVRKLKAANLVEERRDGRYARYHPMAELARFLQLAESSPAEPKADVVETTIVQA